MEAMATSFPILILSATSCRGVLNTSFRTWIVSWKKFATPLCACWFVCPSLNNPLYFSKVKIVCFESLASRKQTTSGFSLDIKFAMSVPCLQFLGCSNVCYLYLKCYSLDFVGVKYLYFDLTSADFFSCSFHSYATYS